MRRVKEKKKLDENIPFSTYRGRKMIDTDHALVRGFERLWSNDQFPTYQDYVEKHIEMLKEAIDIILRKYNDKSGVYLVHSKYSNLGLMVNWREEDEKHTDGNNHAIIITILPPKKVHYPKYKTDTMIYVEAHKWVQSLIEAGNNDKKRLTENTEENTYSRFMTDLGFTVHLFEGEVTDIDAPILIVE